MATASKIKQEIQKLAPDALVALYELDATIVGGSIYHFCEYATTSGSVIEFGGVSYSPLPVELTDYEIPGDGTMPRPHLKVANVNLTFAGAVSAYGDLVGSKLTRRRTFAKYLDNGSDPDPTAQFPADIFYLEQKLNHNKQYIEWELLAAFDLEGIYIPRRQVLRETCTHRYRIYVDGDFDYTDATCPYTGSNYFKADGTATTAANDKCGRRLRDCRLRYPNDSDVLPTRAFPGAGKISYPYR